MLWRDISLFPGLSSIIPASSSRPQTSHQPPEEAFQHQEGVQRPAGDVFQSSRAAVVVVAVFWHSSTSSSLCLQCHGVPAMPSRGMQSLMGSSPRRFQTWLPHGPHIQLPFYFLPIANILLVSSTYHKVPHGKFINLRQYWWRLVFPFISENSAHYSKLPWPKFQSMNLPLLTLLQHFPDIIAHSMTSYSYIWIAFSWKIGVILLN